MARPTVYLSASIANADINAHLAAALCDSPYDVVLPQTFTPDVPHGALPRAIVERCLTEMERCEFAILMLDGFGIDCAMEVGWLHARGVPVVGVAIGSTQFTRHWMVKATLDGLVALDPVVHQTVRNDPILGDVPSVFADGWAALPEALSQVSATLRRRSRTGRTRATPSR